MITNLGETTPEHINDNLESTEDELVIDNISGVSIEHEAIDKKEKGTLAKRFTELVGQGYKPGQAARLVGSSVKGIMSSSRVKKEVATLLETYTLQADVRRALVRAGLNQLALENLGAEGDKKVALDALKAIGGDTEVGINAPPQPGIQINVGNLQSLFTDIPEPDKMGIEQKKDEVISAEFIDVTADTTEVLDSEAISRLGEEIEKENKES